MPSIDDQLRTSLELCSLGKFDDAAALLTSILAARPRHAEALRQMGLLDLQSARGPQAVARFEAAAKAEPKRTDIKVLLGFALLHSGAADRGRALLAIAGADLRTLRGCLTVADLASQVGDPAFTEAHYQAALAIE